MQFKSDEQRKAVFARIRGGRGSGRGIPHPGPVYKRRQYPNFVHSPPASGLMPFNTNFAPKQAEPRILGSTTVSIPGLQDQPSVSTVTGGRPRHGGGGFFGPQGLDFSFGVPLTSQQAGGYATFQDWFNAIQPPKSAASFTDFMFGNTIFDGTFTSGKTEFGGSNLPVDKPEGWVNREGINWSADSK